MKFIRKPLHAAFAFTVALLFLPAARAHSFERAWTSNDGKTITARLAAWDGSRFTLVIRGRQYRVPPSRLDAASREAAWKLLGVDARYATSTPRPVQPDPVPAATVARKTGRDRHGMQLHDFSLRTRIVRTTAYAADESDHLIYGNASAVGTPLRFGNQIRSAAADWSVYPVGTTFRITGLPYLYVVDDYGSALVGTGTIDLYQPDLASMRAWGRRTVEITIIRWGSLSASAAILSRRTRSAHCRAMLAGIRQYPARSGSGTAR